MALLDLSRAKAREVKVIKRTDCHTYERAYEYLQNTLSDYKKSVKNAEKKGKEKPEHPWIVVKKAEGNKKEEISLRITLHSMPLYWSIEELQTERIIYKPMDPNGGDPNLSKVEAERINDIIGSPLYTLSSYEEGEELADALMANEDPDFTVILTRAAHALKQVHEVERLHINLQAEYWYNFRKNNETKNKQGNEIGPWNDKDEGTRMSEKKAQVRNACKTTAANQLGYTRAGKEQLVYR